MKINSLSNSNVNFGILHFIDNAEHKKADSADALAEGADENSFNSIKGMLAKLSQLKEDIYVKATPAHTPYRHGVYLDLYSDPEGKDKLSNFAYENGASAQEHKVWDESNYKQLDGAISGLQKSKEDNLLKDFIRKYCGQFKP